MNTVLSMEWRKNVKVQFDKLFQRGCMLDMVPAVLKFGKKGLRNRYVIVNDLG